jgi:hypothetical protein
MKKAHTTILLFLLPLILFGQNDVCFDIEENPNPNHSALGVFSKFVNVLGCFSIYAESSIPDANVLHAAAVAAELLDNNEDGIVDDPLIESQLISENALMPIFYQDGNSAMNTFFNNYYGNGVSAVLWNDEIDPTQTGHWGDDASVEEIIHTINHVGHTHVYPSAFDLQPNSSLMSAAMDVARGGQFLSVPNNYPSSAWYHYDDWTCDYECMAIEYMYWAIVSYMGILDDPQTAAGIANEWEPYNAILLQSMDTLMYALITDPQYSLPLLAPDGNYCPGNASIGENSLPGSISLVSVYPNPFNPKITIRFSVETQHAPSLHIFDIIGRLVETLINEDVHSGEFEIMWNAGENPSGIYFIKLETENTSITRKVVLIK